MTSLALGVVSLSVAPVCTSLELSSIMVSANKSEVDDGQSFL